MTPEEFALAAACGACMHHQPCMARRADLFRAALRERDAQWRDAIDKYTGHYGGITDECDDCAPLRALLEEAGK